MNENILEFLKGIQTLEPTTVVEEYRAYHDDNGKILWLLAANFPDSNQNWISISKQQYQTLECQWLWIENGKMIERKPNYQHFFSLISSDKGVKIVKGHAGLVVEDDEEYQDIAYYDKRTN